MLQRLRYKLLYDTIRLGHNGLISDLDIVFHLNPFPFLDRLKTYAMTAWIEVWNPPLRALRLFFFLFLHLYHMVLACRPSRST